MNADAAKVKSIFLNLVECCPPDDWPSYLDRECSGNSELRVEVERLLAGHRKDVDLVDQGKAAFKYALPTFGHLTPRIVLAEPLLPLVMKSYGASADRLEPAIEQAICRDVDGWWFVNYLDAARDSRGIQWDLIEQHKTSILESLSHTTRHDVLPKYGWACRYHNVFCHWHRDDSGYDDRYRISRVDEQSTIYRLNDAGP